MSFESSRLAGVMAPIVTPFRSDESICFASLRDNILAYNKTALCGYMPLGSNGEFLSLSEEESVRVLQTVCKYRAPDKLIAASCGRESVRETLRVIGRFAAEGLELAFLLPPHYFAATMTMDDLLAYYTRVADASPVPLVIYHAPKFAAKLDLPPDWIARAARHENILAFKNSSEREDLLYTNALHGISCQVLSGSIRTFYRGLEGGVCGGVLSAASYLPELCCEVYRLYRAGEREKAQALHARLTAQSDAGIGRMGVRGVKLGMQLRGLSGGHVRCPLHDATQDERDLVAQLFAQYGISRHLETR